MMPFADLFDHIWREAFPGMQKGVVLPTMDPLFRSLPFFISVLSPLAGT